MMKFKTLILLFFITSCISNQQGVSKHKKNFVPYTAKGFALIYDEDDYSTKIISGRLNNENLEVGHNKLKKNSIIVITNPENNKKISLKVTKKIDYPNFYKVLITERIAKKLEINRDAPFIDVEEKVKNMSFIAKKAVTFSEEKTVSDKAPVTMVKINNIASKQQTNLSKNRKKFNIIIGDFFSKESSVDLKNFLSNNYIDSDNLKVKKLEKNKFRLYAGPYYSINTLKKDYFKLNRYGFEDLDIEQNE